MPRYSLEVVVEGKDRASGMLRGVGGVLGNIASVAGGILAAQVFSRIGEGIASMARNAVDAAGQMQNLQIALEGLIARELARGDEVTKTSQKVLHLTDEERERLADLKTDLDLANAKMAEHRQRIWDIENTWTEQPVVRLRTMKAELAQMAEKTGELGAEIDKLASKEGKLVQVNQKVRVNTMDIGEAMGLAAPKAAELLDKIRDLSLVSPFEYQTVVNTMRLQMAFGATADEAVPLTKALLDTAAGLGLSGEAADRLAYNFGQIRSVGQIMGVDMRQLRMVGLDLADVFRSQLGMSVEEVNKKLKQGKLTMEDVSNAFVQYAEENFGGASERMSKTFQGLKSSFKDLFFFAGADLLTPALEKVTEWLGGIFDKARGIIEDGSLKKAGDILGDIVDALFSGDWVAVTDGIAKAIAAFNLPPAIAGSVEALGYLFEAIGDVLAGDLDRALMNFATGISKLAGALLGLDTEQVRTLAVAIIDIGKGLAAVKGLGDWDRLAEGIGGVMGVLAGADLKNIPLLAAALDKLADAWERFTKDPFEEDAGQWVSAWETLGFMTEKTDPLYGLAQAIDAVADALNKISAAFETLNQFYADKFKPMWDGLFGEGQQTVGKQDNRQAWWQTFFGDIDQQIPEWEKSTQRMHEVTLEFVEDEKEAWRGLSEDLVGKSIIPDMMEDIVAEFKALPGDIKKAVEGAMDSLKEAGKQIVEGLKDGIKDNWQGFLDWLVEQMASILGAIKAFFGIDSPSKVMAGVGANMVKGLQMGWDKGMGVFRAGVVGGFDGMATMGAGASGTGYGMGMGGGYEQHNYYIQDKMAAAIILADRERQRERRLSGAMGG
uniref:Putative tail protein n=2 Tax=viral metagenome TaxID=1070528 RepID=A0A6M3KPM1_9ZZZZ